MKLKSNIDYGLAFRMLKEGMKASENIVKSGGTIAQRYITAYSMLSGFVEAAIEYVEDKTEGETLPINSPTEDSVS
jgi:hypothetical protein